MNKIFNLSRVFLSVLIGSLMLSASAAAKEPVMVFAAASLKDALQEIARDFKKDYRADVSFNFGGSLALAVQIEHGAKCDIFIAADKASTERLLKKGFLEPGTSLDILRNYLVIVGDPKSDESITSLYDLKLEKGDHIAIADPKIAPAGVYTMQALKNAGLDEKLKDFIVPALDVRAALALAQSGNAKYAVVYFSDTRKAPELKQFYRIPDKLYDPVVYSAGLVKSAGRSVPARNFLEFLKSKECKSIFEKYGFGTL